MLYTYFKHLLYPYFLQETFSLNILLLFCFKQKCRPPNYALETEHLLLDALRVMHVVVLRFVKHQ